jgi:hypothetical protein
MSQVVFTQELNLHVFSKKNDILHDVYVQIIREASGL